MIADLATLDWARAIVNDFIGMYKGYTIKSLVVKKQGSGYVVKTDFKVEDRVVTALNNYIKTSGIKIKSISYKNTASHNHLTLVKADKDKQGYISFDFEW